MVNKQELAKVIKNYLPEAEKNTVDEIASDIARQTELQIYSLVRQAVYFERKNKMGTRCKPAALSQNFAGRGDPA